MSSSLKLFMVIISVITFAYIIRKIRKAQVQITDMCYWVFFSIALIVLAVFPEAAWGMAKLLGIATAVNFVFLAVIFLLMMELFFISVKVSKLENKIIDLSGEIAIQEEKEIK